MPRLVTVTGRVLDPAGEARAGITVEFVPNSAISGDPNYVSAQKVVASTDAQGRLSFNGQANVVLRSGTYSVRINNMDTFVIVVPDTSSTATFAALIQNLERI